MLARPFRLVKPQDFSKVYKRGKRFSGGALSLIYLKSNQNTTRFGFVVSTKHVGKIVRRNRLKRILKEEIRRLWKDLRGGVDVVIQARPGVGDIPSPEIRGELMGLLKRTNLLKDDPDNNKTR